MKSIKQKFIVSMVLLMGLGIGIAGAFYFSPNSFSNHPFLKDLVQKFTNYQEEHGEDKVYLHFDKKFYEPGEDIWFNAYVRDAQSFKASENSEVVYVELQNPKGAVEQELTLIAQAGKAAGDFHLPEDIKGGIYKVKAYTKWQENTKTFFERDITIQKSVLPNLNMKLNFDRKAYGTGDQVDATLDLNTLTNEPLAHHLFNYVVSLDGEVVKKGESKTGAAGRSNLDFKLPKDLETNDGLLNILFQYKGQTESISRSIPIVLGNIDLQFYPEGGELVETMICGVGFKALNEFGKAADVKGNIVDQNDKVVATFDSYHMGMGSFEMAAQADQKYFAKITSPANITKTYALPKALQKGYTLKIHKQTENAIDVEVISSENEELFLVAQNRNQIYYTKDLQAKAGINRVTISTQDFPIGITQLTLFDSKKIARAERLAFVNHDKQLNIKVTTDKEKYLPREKVNMTVEVTDERGIPMPGSFSLAVVDDKLLTFADDKQGHILSQMLLESDLTGKIEEPNFYFDNKNDPTRLKPEVDRNEAMDHLMMTQGWRKFTWEEVMSGNAVAYTQAGELARIAGKVVNSESTPLSGATVELVGQNKKQLTNKDGSFNINDWKMHESVHLKISSKGYFPVTTRLEDYNAHLALTMFKERTITGVVKNKEKQATPHLQVYAGAYANTTTDKDGRFTLTIPANVETISIYGGGYDEQNIPLKKNENDLKVVMEYMRIYPSSVRSAQQHVNRGGALGNANRFEDPAPEPDAVAEEIDVLDDMVDLEVHGEDDGKVKVEELKKLEEVVEKVDDKAPMDEPEEVEAIEEVIDEDIVMNQRDVADKDVLFDLKKELERKKASIRTSRYSRVREFPVVKYESKTTAALRSDFRKTIYFNPNVEVGKDGKAALSFYNSDDITQFRVTIEGFSVDGGIGRVEQKYFTQLPVEMLTKVPREVLTGDKINIPLTLTNNTENSIEGKLTLKVPSHVQLLKAAPNTIKLAAGASKTILLECEVLDVIASGDFVITFEADGLKDQFATIIDARPRGFPVNEVFAGDQMSNDFNIVLQEAMDGSVVAKLQAYPNTLDEVMKGMESMLRMPGGCFEQTSSSNYPNLLVLDYLRETGASMPAIEDQAKGYLKVGYKRLVGYESKGGGFDWWGRDPAHEALSAYGLMEFVDMQAVFDVDKAIIKRTADWLLSRKDGKGGWNKNPNALHSWAVAEVTDAYIVWAITEAGYSKEITKELDKSYNDAIKSEDAYMMALMANALFNAKDKRAEELVKELSKLQQKDGSFMGLTSSVTNSTGQSLMIETSSLAALAMMRTKGYNKQIESAIRAVQNGKTYYGYGSTQGTVLALKAILQYAKNSKRAAESGELVVYVDNKKVTTLAYTADQKEILLPNIAKFLKAGKQKVSVQYNATKTAMPFDLELTYTTRLPQNSPDCKLSLSTKLPKNKVKMGETVRLTTTLTNITKEGQPMTMAMVGIPAGLSLQPWQLKELQEKNIVDYYELFDGYVVFHYEQLKANEIKTVHLDLKADVPGQYEAPASSAFLYYTNEHKVWSTPDLMTIN